MEGLGEILSSSHAEALDLPSPPPRIKLADVEPESEIVAFVNGEMEVFAQSFHSSKTRKLSIKHKKRINWICIKQKVVATTSSDGTCSIESLEDSSIQTVKRSDFPVATDCDLSTGADLLGILFADEKKQVSEVVIVKRETNRIIYTWTVDAFLGKIDLSPDGRFTFLFEKDASLPGKFSCKVCQTHTGTVLGALNVESVKFIGTDAAEVCVPRISSDATADHVVVSDISSLRVWRINEPGMPVYALPNYAAAGTLVTKGKYGIGECAVSRDGSRVVAAVAGNCFGIWDMRRLTRIATLAGHQGIPRARAISADGKSIFTVSSSGFAHKWIMPARERQPSALETALGAALSDSSVLDEAFVLKHIHSRNVKTACDLLAGHNLILLSIRAGFITRDNIRNLGGSGWYLQDNLYLPASKLTTENAMTIDAVLHHAESLGIIANGYALKIAREIRTDMQTEVEGVSKAIETLAERVGVVENRASVLEGRATALEGNVDELHSALGKMSLNQRKLQEGVLGLSQNLTQLQKSIRKQDRRNGRVQVARCMLCFIPLVGKVLGEAASAVDVLMNLKMEDLLPAGVDTTKAIMTHMASVDLSNFQVARYAFSNEVLAKLKPPARGAAISALCGSGFKSPDALEAVLREHIASSRHREPSIALLDIGSSSWLSRDSELQGSSSSGEAHALDEKARKYFQCMTHATERAGLSVEEAKVELNQFLGKCDGLTAVANVKLEASFFDLADEDAEEVTEEIFVEMFRAVRTEQDEKNLTSQMIDGCAERFRKRAHPGTSLSLPMASRIVSNLQKEMVQRQQVRTETCVEPGNVLEKMREFDADRSDSIEEGEFLTAVKELLHICDERLV